MLCMHKQCVPGLHFPPPQNTGLGTRLGWSSNKLTLLVSGYAVVALAVYLAVSSSLSLLKCSTTCLHLARTVDSQLAFSAIWTERFNVWPAHGICSLLRSSSIDFTILLPLSVVKAFTWCSKSIPHSLVPACNASVMCSWSCTPGKCWVCRFLWNISNSSVTQWQVREMYPSLAWEVHM